MMSGGKDRMFWTGTASGLGKKYWFLVQVTRSIASKSNIRNFAALIFQDDIPDKPVHLRVRSG